MFKIRAATQSDATGIAIVQVTAWQSGFRGIVASEFLDSMSQQESSRRFAQLFDNPEKFCFVAEDGGIITGFAAAGPERSGKGASKNELYAFYVLPSEQRRGVGRALFRAVTEKFKTTANPGLVLWTLKASPYRNFYIKHDGREAGDGKIEIGGRQYQTTSYLWNNLP